MRYCKSYIRHKIALWSIRLARRATEWGFADEHLEAAERAETWDWKHLYD